LLDYFTELLDTHSWSAVKALRSFQWVAGYKSSPPR
jgi:hypothetical protein